MTVGKGGFCFKIKTAHQGSSTTADSSPAKQRSSLHTTARKIRIALRSDCHQFDNFRRSTPFHLQHSATDLDCFGASPQLHPATPHYYSAAIKCRIASQRVHQTAGAAPLHRPSLATTMYRVSTASPVQSPCWCHRPSAAHHLQRVQSSRTAAGCVATTPCHLAHQLFVLFYKYSSGHYPARPARRSGQWAVGAECNKTGAHTGAKVIKRLLHRPQ